MHELSPVVYNWHKVLELLSNLAWLVVAISMWGLWFVRRGMRKRSLIPAIGAQAIALAMLTVILLPAISITDDLHACQLPAEIRRSVLQSDRHLNPAAPPGVLPFALALLALCTNSLEPRGITCLAVEQRAPLHIHGYLRSLWSRPPPSSIA